MTILLYHNLIKDSEVDENLFRRVYEGSPCLYYRKESDFKRDMWRLGNYGVDWIGREEKNNVAITFDDAKEAVYKIAYPVLKEYNYRFSVFVPTALVGTEGYCTWEQLREMNGLGRIESHGHKHLPFDSLSEEEVKKELDKSFHLIKEKIGREAMYVSCPASRRISKKIVQECGYRDIRYNLGEIKVIRNHD